MYVYKCSRPSLISRIPKQRTPEVRSKIQELTIIMEISTTLYSHIFLSNNNLRTKGPCPSSVTTILAKQRTPPLSPPPLALQPVLSSKHSAQSTRKNVAGPETTDDISSSSSNCPAASRPKPATQRVAPLSLPMAFCNCLEHIIHTVLDPPVIHPYVDPRHVLANNFAPVDELPPTKCPIIHGTIPDCLVGGAYIRNGPNPQHWPRRTHHLYDGDGMLHCLILSEDKEAMLCSRYVKTYKYHIEHEAGAPLIPNTFSGYHGFAGVALRVVSILRMLTGQYNPAQGIGMANTSLLFFGGCLYALGEPDLPYTMHVDPATGEIITIGRCDFKGQMAIGMTAHPKKDPVTGELFGFRYAPVPPYLMYYHFDAAGEKLTHVPIFSLKQPSFIHDFALTENYAVFNDIQLVMQPIEFLLGHGAPVGYDKDKVPRLGVLPRYALDESEIRWFDVPGFNMMHSINAWEEEGENGEQFLVLVAPNASIEHMLQMELMKTCVEMVRINLDSGVVTRKPLDHSDDKLELGVIHPGYMGRKNRYAYLAVGNPLPHISGVAKLDFSLADTGNCVVARHEFGPGCFGGEPFFVPNDGAVEEDDGYLLSFVHNEGMGESRFVVMDARSPNLDIVAEVPLPGRVPYGFHGLFISRDELLSQKNVSLTQAN